LPFGPKGVCLHASPDSSVRKAKSQVGSLAKHASFAGTMVYISSLERLFIVAILSIRSTFGLQCGAGLVGVRNYPSCLKPPVSSSPMLRNQRARLLFATEGSGIAEGGDVESGPASLGDLKTPPADVEPLQSPQLRASPPLLEPLKWSKIVTLLAGQVLMVGLASVISWVSRGSPLEIFGSGPLLLKGGVLATLGWGVVATAPLLGFIALEGTLQLEKRFPAFELVSNATKATTLLILGNKRAPLAAGFGSLLLAISAGFGEEVLFRGVLQDSLVRLLPGSPTVGLVMAAGIFGALHAVTPLYAFIAGGAGLYFGWLYSACHSSIAVPALAHTLYDWAALFLVHLEVTSPPKGGDGSPASTKAMQLGIMQSQQRK